MFEPVLVFMCTGALRTPNTMEDQLDAAFEIAMVACRLGMEDLEWCASGKLEEYFEINKSTYLPQAASEHILHSTGITSHLCEWLRIMLRVV